MLKKNPNVLMIWVYFLNEEPGEDPTHWQPSLTRFNGDVTGKILMEMLPKNRSVFTEDRFHLMLENELSEAVN